MPLCCAWNHPIHEQLSASLARIKKRFTKEGHPRGCMNKAKWLYDIDVGHCHDILSGMWNITKKLDEHRLPLTPNYSCCKNGMMDAGIGCCRQRDDAYKTLDEQVQLCCGYSDEYLKKHVACSGGKLPCCEGSCGKDKLNGLCSDGKSAVITDYQSCSVVREKLG